MSKSAGNCCCDGEGPESCTILSDNLKLDTHFPGIPLIDDGSGGYNLVDETGAMDVRLYISYTDQPDSFCIIARGNTADGSGSRIFGHLALYKGNQLLSARTTNIDVTGGQTYGFSLTFGDGFLYGGTDLDGPLWIDGQTGSSPKVAIGIGTQIWECTESHPAGLSSGKISLAFLMDHDDGFVYLSNFLWSRYQDTGDVLKFCPAAGDVCGWTYQPPHFPGSANPNGTVPNTEDSWTGGSWSWQHCAANGDFATTSSGTLVCSQPCPIGGNLNMSCSFTARASDSDELMAYVDYDYNQGAAYYAQLTVGASGKVGLYDGNNHLIEEKSCSTDHTGDVSVSCCRYNDLVVAKAGGIEVVHHIPPGSGGQSSGYYHYRVAVGTGAVASCVRMVSCGGVRTLDDNPVSDIEQTTCDVCTYVDDCCSALEVTPPATDTNTYKIDLGQPGFIQGHPEVCWCPGEFNDGYVYSYFGCDMPFFSGCSACPSIKGQFTLKRGTGTDQPITSLCKWVYKTSTIRCDVFNLPIPRPSDGSCGSAWKRDTAGLDGRLNFRITLSLYPAYTGPYAIAGPHENCWWHCLIELFPTSPIPGEANWDGWAMSGAFDTYGNSPFWAVYATDGNDDSVLTTPSPWTLKLAYSARRKGPADTGFYPTVFCDCSQSDGPLDSNNNFSTYQPTPGDQVTSWGMCDGGPWEDTITLTG